MKVKTVLAKIVNDYQHSDNDQEKTALNFDGFIEELESATNLAIEKERKTLINKFSKMTNLTPEEIEKKLLPKEKRNITQEKMKTLEKINSDQVTLYEEIEIDGKEYYCQKVDHGLVIEFVTSDQTILVGYYLKGKVNLIK